MNKVSAVAVISLACAGVANAQGRPLDWSFYGGDAQRTGWEKSDIRITKDNVKDFQLVLKRKFDNKEKGPRSLTPPVLIGMLISYKGFKELAFVADSSDNLWSIDADLDRVFWKRHFETSSEKPKATGTSPDCSAMVTATPSLTPPMNFAARPRTAGAAAAAAPAAPATPPPGRGILGAGGFGAPRPAFAVSSDGKLHLLNTSTGEDVGPAMNFLPPGAKASALTVLDGVVYTTTGSGCGGAPNAVWAIDLNTPEAKVTTFALNGGGVSPLGGLAMGTDGTVYVQTGAGSNTVLALTPKDLKLKDSFAITGGSGTSLTTPVVFAHNERDVIVTGGADGRLYLLDSQSLGGSDKKTPLYQTAPLSTGGNGAWGGLSTWQDQDGTRWVLAPVWGPVNPELKALANNGSAPNGSIIGFRVEESNGKPVLTPAWVSRDMNSPLPPVITSGVVFAVSAGEYGPGERPKGSTHATLYALDGTSGKEMYTTGNQVTAPGGLNGVTIANGRVYFTTNDNTLYAFGIFLER
jgi:outer membrane protein assembly factor BamB